MPAKKTVKDGPKINRRGGPIKKRTKRLDRGKALRMMTKSAYEFGKPIVNKAYEVGKPMVRSTMSNMYDRSSKYIKDLLEENRVPRVTNNPSWVNLRSALNEKLFEIGHDEIDIGLYMRSVEAFLDKYKGISFSKVDIRQAGHTLKGKDVGSALETYMKTALKKGVTVKTMIEIFEYLFSHKLTPEEEEDTEMSESDQGFPDVKEKKRLEAIKRKMNHLERIADKSSEALNMYTLPRDITTETMALNGALKNIADLVNQEASSPLPSDSIMIGRVMQKYTDLVKKHQESPKNHKVKNPFLAESKKKKKTKKTKKTKKRYKRIKKKMKGGLKPTVNSIKINKSTPQSPSNKIESFRSAKLAEGISYSPEMIRSPTIHSPNLELARESITYPILELLPPRQLQVDTSVRGILKLEKTDADGVKEGEDSPYMVTVIIGGKEYTAESIDTETNVANITLTEDISQPVQPTEVTVSRNRKGDFIVYTAKPKEILYLDNQLQLEYELETDTTAGHYSLLRNADDYQETPRGDETDNTRETDTILFAGLLVWSSDGIAQCYRNDCGRYHPDVNDATYFAKINTDFAKSGFFKPITLEERKKEFWGGCIICNNEFRVNDLRRGWLPPNLVERPRWENVCLKDYNEHCKKRCGECVDCLQGFPEYCIKNKLWDDAELPTISASDLVN